jgi:hypothetical protein
MLPLRLVTDSEIEEDTVEVVVEAISPGIYPRKGLQEPNPGG